MHGFTDSDWDVKHSTSGFVFTLHRAAISWGSKKQTSVALSSCEAELMASSEAGKEAVYLRSFLEELGVGHEASTEMGMDNQAGRELAYNPEHPVALRFWDPYRKVLKYSIFLLLYWL